jgi:hypothetical protein
MRWARHVASVGVVKLIYNIVVGNLKETAWKIYKEMWKWIY